MASTFDKLNKTELQEKIKLMKLEDEVSKLNKSADKVTNSDLVKILEADQASKRTELGMDEDDSSVNTGSKMTKQEEKEAVAELTKEFMAAGIAVIVTDHDSSQSVEGDVLGRVFTGSYGNKESGGSKPFIVKLDGGRQSLERGVVEHLRGISAVLNVNDENGKPQQVLSKRFGITEVEGWTQTELEGLKIKQATNK